MGRSRSKSRSRPGGSSRRSSSSGRPRGGSAARRQSEETSLGAANAVGGEGEAISKTPTNKGSGRLLGGNEGLGSIPESGAQDVKEEVPEKAPASSGSIGKFLPTTYAHMRKSSGEFLRHHVCTFDIFSIPTAPSSAPIIVYIAQMKLSRAHV